MGKLWSLVPYAREDQYEQLTKKKKNCMKNVFIHTILQKFTNMKFGQGSEWGHTIQDNPSPIYR